MHKGSHELLRRGLHAPGQKLLLQAVVGTWLPARCGGEDDGMREAGLAGGQGGLEINAQPERG